MGRADDIRSTIATLQDELAHIETPTMITPVRPRLDGDGPGMVEYALILVLVAIATTSMLGWLGSFISNVFSNVVYALGR